MLKFDLSAIPASSQIISADLNLWLSSVSNDLPINVDVYELSSSWTESGASWNKRNESTAWTNKGGDYKNTLLSTTGLSNLLDLSTNIKWKIPKDVVQKWIENPSTNHGFLLKSSDETKATYKKFISGDHPEFSSTSYSPMLVVSYYPISRLGFEDYWTYDYHPLTGGISATNLTTGNNIIQFNDFSFGSRGGTEIDFTRTYNSKSFEESPFGFGWTFTGNESIIDSPQDGEVIYTDADGTSHTFTYDQTSQSYQSPKGKYLTLKKQPKSYELFDKYGNKSVFEVAETWMDSNKRSISKARINYSEDKLGNRITYHYNDKDQLEGMTDPSGRSIHFSYNGNNRIISASFENWKLNYRYNSKNQLTYVDEYELDGTIKTTQFVYNSDGTLLIDVIDPNQRKTTFTYENSFLTKVQEPSGEGVNQDPATRPGTTYSYDIGQYLSTVTDPNGNTTTYRSNGDYVITKETDPKNLSTEYKVDANYNPIEVIDPAGHSTFMAYDEKGNLQKTVDPEGNVETFTYDSLSNILTSTDTRGNVTTNHYDAKGLLVSTTDAKEKVTSYTYDEFGNLTSTLYPNGATETYGYDQNGNYIKTVKMDGNTVTTTMDQMGNILDYTDSKEFTTHFEYNHRNQLTKVKDQISETNVQYDDAGNLIEISHPNNGVERFEYNGKNLLTKATDTLNHSAIYNYDLNGNLLSQKLPTGMVLSHKYDELDQLSETFINGKKLWGYTYDQNGNLKSVTDKNGTVKTYLYLTNDLVQSITKGVTTLQYGYSGTDYVNALRFVSGTQSVDYQFKPNALNQLESINRNGAQIASFHYNSLGVVDSITRSNNVSTQMKFDQTNRLEEYSTIDNNGAPIDHFTYQYDQNKNISSILSDNSQVNYEYDERNQLTKEILADGKNITYEYDKQGNRTKKSVNNGNSPTVTNYTYNSENQLIQVNEQSYEYDLNGNLLADGTFNYRYDEQGQLIEVKNKDGVLASYSYDEDGKRIKKTTADGTINYHYDGDQLLFETDDANNITAEYSWDDEGNPITLAKNGKVYYYLINGQGDVTKLTDQNGNVVANYEYDVWGNVKKQSGNLADENPIRYAGYYFDKETDHYYLLSRYYNPDTGTFLSNDEYPGEMDQPLTLNGYIYANNNPLIFHDPDGYAAKQNKAQLIGPGSWGSPRAGGGGGTKSSSKIIKFKNFNNHYKKHVTKQKEFKTKISKKQYYNKALDLATRKADGKDVFRKKLSKGREASYRKSTNEVVITHNGREIGTFFRPSNGKRYYDKLK